MVFLALCATPVRAEAEGPLIDIHVHAYEAQRPSGIYGSRGPQGLIGSANQRAHFEETYSQLRKHNIQKAIVTGPPDGLETWMKWDTEGRFIPALYMNHPSDYELTPAKFEEWVKAGKVKDGIDFSVNASAEYDIFIKYITCEIGDGGTPALNKFGNLAELTNGVAWYWDTQQEPLYELHEGIKTNKEFIRIASDTAAIGTASHCTVASIGNASLKVGLSVSTVKVKT